MPWSQNSAPYWNRRCSILGLENRTTTRFPVISGAVSMVNAGIHVAEVVSRFLYFLTNNPKRTPMTPLIKLSAISFLLACSTPLLACSDDESEQQERGQNPNNQGGVIQRFEDSQSFNARSLVSAVDSDGTIFVAYIDKSTGLPKMGELDGEHVALPGEWEAVNSLSMVVTPDGSFHLVGDPQGA
ncbi:MAG: hypothetical protein JKY56_17900, partial [Kofleriaceae bacterium]|nr:hypothetical protein [Kofleriaceae bacterium]